MHVECGDAIIARTLRCWTHSRRKRRGGGRGGTLKGPRDVTGAAHSPHFAVNPGAQMSDGGTIVQSVQIVRAASTAVSKSGSASEVIAVRDYCSTPWGPFFVRFPPKKHKSLSEGRF